MMCADTKQPRAAYMFSNISTKRTMDEYFFTVKASFKGNFARLSDLRCQPFDRPKEVFAAVASDSRRSQYVLHGLKPIRGAAL